MKHILICAAVLTLLGATRAHAAPNEYTALLKAEKFAEVERLAAARLGKEPGNAEAMVARTTAIVGSGAKARIPEAVAQAQRCVAAQPNHADCHLMLGKALGWKAMVGGIMSALGYAGDIRDAFKKAVELDPRNLDARFSLLQYYMMAPAIAGGGSGKATGLVAQTAALEPEAGKIMQAMLEVDDGNLARAESLGLAVRPGTNDEMISRHDALLNTIAGKYVNEKKLGDAERVVQAGLRQHPDSEHLGYSMARVRQEQGRHREALAGFEPLAAKHARAHILYRIGQSQQALGDKARAVAAFEKALAASPSLSAKFKSDAESQLAKLKG